MLVLAKHFTGKSWFVCLCHEPSRIRKFESTLFVFEYQKRFLLHKLLCFHLHCFVLAERENSLRHYPYPQNTEISKFI